MIVAVQLRDLRGCIDFYLVAILDELGTIVAAYLLDRQAFSIVSLSFFVPRLEIIVQFFFSPSCHPIRLRTIIGCQALDYVNKTIYLLHDTRRVEVNDLAETLGCKYLTRADNSHATGNLNHALHQTNGELVVVFDAEFISTKNFLSRPVGFFIDEQVALVQTR